MAPVLTSTRSVQVDRAHAVAMLPRAPVPVPPLDLAAATSDSLEASAVVGCRAQMRPHRHIRLDAVGSSAIRARALPLAAAAGQAGKQSQHSRVALTGITAVTH